MSEIYKIKMELTNDEFYRLCELLNIDINFLQPARKEPNNFSAEIMRKMRVETKERNYEMNRTLNKFIANEEKQINELKREFNFACDNHLPGQELYDELSYHKMLYIFLCELRDRREGD